MGEIANPVGIITVLPPAGAWFVYSSDCHGSPLALFGDELSARRWADEHCWGWGRVMFWPFGWEWKEVPRL